MHAAKTALAVCDTAEDPTRVRPPVPVVSGMVHTFAFEEMSVVEIAKQDIITPTKKAKTAILGSPDKEVLHFSECPKEKADKCHYWKQKNNITMILDCKNIGGARDQAMRFLENHGQRREISVEVGMLRKHMKIRTAPQS